MGSLRTYSRPRNLVILFIVIAIAVIVTFFTISSSLLEKKKVSKNGPRPGTIAAPDGNLEMLNPPNKDLQMNGSLKDRPKFEEFIVVNNGVTSTSTQVETAVPTDIGVGTPVDYIPTTLETVVRPPVTEVPAEPTVSPAPPPIAQAQYIEPQPVQNIPAPVPAPVIPQGIPQNEQAFTGPQRLTVPQATPNYQQEPYIQSQAKAEYIQAPGDQLAAVDGPIGAQMAPKTGTELNTNANIGVVNTEYAAREKGLKSNQQMQEITNDIVY